MDRVLLDEVIHTDYGQFDLGWGGDDYVGFEGSFDVHFDGQVNGLVGAAHPDGVYLILARRSGGSPVRIALLDTAPDVDDAWEDVVEVSVTLPEGRTLGWTSWAGESGGLLDGVPAGDYRLRVSARGRDRGREDEFADEPVDAYLLEMWPAPWQPDAIVKVGSDDARYWHGEVGSRR